MGCCLFIEVSLRGVIPDVVVDLTPKTSGKIETLFV